MIKNYTEYINEEYGFPKSLDSLTNYLFSFIKSKFDWWLSRNSLANYYEEFNFDQFDLEDFYNIDFPIGNLEFELHMKSVPTRSSDVSGFATSFRGKNQQQYFLSKLSHNKIVAKMGLEININVNKQGYDYIIQEIDLTIKHELLHLYQGYKHRKNNLNYKFTTDLNFFGRVISDILCYDIEDIHLRKLFRIFYVFVSKFEIDAHVAGAKIENDPLYKYMLEFKNMNEFSYNEKEGAEIFNIFKTICQRYGDTKIKYINSLLASKTSDDFINKIFKYVKNKIPLFIKKVHKKEFTSEGIRNHYTEMGVDKYYSTKKEEYINPHEKNIELCLDWCVKNINIENFLDLSCGNGEVSKYLKKLNINNFKGCDPHFYDIYKNNFDKECFNLSFQDIAKKGIPESFQTIVCSYALHLCPPSYFNTLLYQLASKCENLIIISPSKYPIVEKYFQLIDSTIINRTHCRIYESNL